MNSLYMDLKEKHQYSDAYLIIKNCFSRDLKNPQTFKEFVDFALELSTFNITINERKNYVNDAVAALTLFSENAELNSELLSLIKTIQSKVQTCTNNILQDEQSAYQEQEHTIYIKNNDLLNELAAKAKMLENAKLQSEVDRILGEISVIEASLSKDKFNKAQNSSYEELTKLFSQLISQKLEELNRKELLQINRRAVESIRDVFETFTRNKSKYQNSETNLRHLMTAKFFIFDTSKLFNESLIYYNHVYAIIFQEVNDNLKYKLTEWAITTVKNG